MPEMDHKPFNSVRANPWAANHVDRPCIWHVGGDDVRLRIPILLELKKLGFSVGAIGSEPEEPFRNAGIPYWRYSLHRWISPLSDRQSVAQLTRLFRVYRPDIVHGFDTKPAMFAMHAAKSAAIAARVRTINGMGYVFSSRSPVALALRPVYRYLQRQASQAASVTVFQNSDDRTYFLSNGMVSEDKCDLVLSSGIDVEAFRASVPDDEALQQLRHALGLSGKTVVTMVARMIRNKGVREYLKAARSVVADFPQTAFLLVGPVASEGRQAVPLAEIQGYAPNVRYLGRRDDVPALMAISDMVVLPSYYREGVPRTLLEAGVLGKAMITTDMPGCREVVSHGENGLLAPIRDARALAQAIAELLGNEALRNSMGAKSAAFVKQKFNLRHVAEAYAEIYEKSLKAVQ